MPIAAFFNTAKSIPSNIVNEILWLHKRMGHPSRGVMSKAIRERSWIGIPSHITALISDHAMKRNPCTACDISKRNKLPIPCGSGVHPVEPGLVLSIDWQGAVNPSSVRGYVGFYLIKDLHSAYLHAIPTRDKTAATYRATLALAIDFYQTHGHRVLKIRSDAGSAENALESAEFLSQFNIITDTAAPDEQQQNPVEREMQTLKKGVSALLIDQTALGPSWVSMLC